MNNSLILKFLSISFIFLSIGCSKDSNNESFLYQVSGRVSSEAGNTNNVIVQIDDKENFKTTTNDNGEFMISGVPSGEHVLQIFKQYEGQMFSQKRFEISVNENINLDGLRLPSPLNLNEPSAITENSISLKWSKADETDFYEYKVYVKDDAGIDESTGELIYVGTDINDVTFEHDNLLPDKEYFYRVFLRNQFGQLGGSNIISTKTLEGELIRDGGFENVNSNTFHWDLLSNSSLVNEVTSETSAEGLSCLYNQLPLLDNNFIGATVMETTYFINVEVGRSYELNAYARVQGEHTEGTTNVWVLVYQDNISVSVLDFNFDSNNSNGIGYIEDTGWVQKSKIFQVNDDSPIRIRLMTGFQNTWIDGLKLTPL